MFRLPTLLLFLAITSGEALDAGFPSEDTIKPPVGFEWLPEYRDLAQELSENLPYLSFKFLYDVDLFFSLKREHDGLLEETIAFLLIDKCKTSDFGKFSWRKEQKFAKLYKSLIIEPCETVKHIYEKYHVEADEILKEYTEHDLTIQRGADYDPLKISRLGAISAHCYHLEILSTMKRTYEMFIDRCRHR